MTEWEEGRKIWKFEMFIRPHGHSTTKLNRGGYRGYGVSDYVLTVRDKRLKINESVTEEFKEDYNNSITLNCQDLDDITWNYFLYTIKYKEREGHKYSYNLNTDC